MSNLLEPIAKITTYYLPGYKRGALLQTLPCKGVLQRDIALSYPELSQLTGPIVVICGSLDGVNWQWKDIYEWDTSAQLPQFGIEEILLI
jgi:hypothetical protein